MSEYFDKFNPDDILNQISDKSFSNVELQINEIEKKMFELREHLRGIISNLKDMGYEENDPDAVIPFYKRDNKTGEVIEDKDTENEYEELKRDKIGIEEELVDLQKDLEGLKSEL